MQILSHQFICIVFKEQVIADVGLCVAVVGLDSIGDPLIYPGEGASHTVCSFRLAVFRPFRNQVLVGTLINCDATGLVGMMHANVDIIQRRRSLCSVLVCMCATFYGHSFLICIVSVCGVQS